jgi:hypothetical protein
MQEKIVAVWAIGALIAMLGQELAAVHAGAMGQTSYDHVHGAVRMAAGGSGRPASRERHRVAF